MMYLMIQR